MHRKRKMMVTKRWVELDPKTMGTQPLLVMSFFRRVALKSVMAAKNRWPSALAPFNMVLDALMVLTPSSRPLKYFPKAHPTRCLVALDLTAAFPERLAMCYA